MTGKRSSYRLNVEVLEQDNVNLVFFFLTTWQVPAPYLTIYIWTASTGRFPAARLPTSQGLQLPVPCLITSQN